MLTVVPTPEERRQYARVDIVRAIFLEEVSRGLRNQPVGPVIKCETVDISVKGLKLLVPVAIQPGSLLNIAVPGDAWIENLELLGEARWLRQADGNKGYWLGLELADTNIDNMEKWFTIVTKLQHSVNAYPSGV